MTIVMYGIQNEEVAEVDASNCAATSEDDKAGTDFKEDEEGLEQRDIGDAGDDGEGTSVEDLDEEVNSKPFFWVYWDDLGYMVKYNVHDQVALFKI